jgi:hypothetical protein
LSVHGENPFSQKVIIHRMDDPATCGFLANTIRMSGTAVSLRPPIGEVMSIVFLAVFGALSLAQLIFWEVLRDTLGAAASVSLLGLSASLTLITASYVTATHTFPAGKNG